MTARWVVEEIEEPRDLAITWQPISLLLKNQPSENSSYYEPLLKTYKMLRVMESVRAAHGNDGVFALYWELGTRIHQRQDHDFEIGDALAAAGLDPSHATAFESDDFDDEIRQRHDAGLALTGNDVGTPLIAFTGDDGVKRGIFGPVISQPLSGQDALDLWDAMVTMMSIDGFWELKRTRTEGPNFGPI